MGMRGVRYVRRRSLKIRRGCRALEYHTVRNIFGKSSGENVGGKTYKSVATDRRGETNK